jgi:hypothetical protein
MFFRFKRMRAMDPLQVAMTGARMGERFLQIGCDDAALLSGLGAKVGLSGGAALVADDEATAERARAIAAKAGVLLDVRVGAPATWGFDEGAFDMVVIDDTRGRFAARGADDRAQCLSVAWHALRTGGRIELVERMEGGGMFGSGATKPPDEYVHAGGPEGVLRAAGFTPVRLLAEKDGFRFVEGLKGANREGGS